MSEIKINVFMHNLPCSKGKIQQAKNLKLENEKKTDVSFFP